MSETSDVAEAAAPPERCPACNAAQDNHYQSPRSDMKKMVYACGAVRYYMPDTGNVIWHPCLTGWHAAAGKRAERDVLRAALKVAREYVVARHTFVKNFGSDARKMDVDADLKQVELALTFSKEPTDDR